MKVFLLVFLLASGAAFGEAESINEPTNATDKKLVDDETEAAQKFQKDYYKANTEYNKESIAKVFDYADAYTTCKAACPADPATGCESQQAGYSQMCVQRRNCLDDCKVQYTKDAAVLTGGKAEVYVDYYMTGNETNYKGEAPTARPDSQSFKLKTADTSYMPAPRQDRVLFDDSAGSKQVPNFAHTLGISPEKGKVDPAAPAYTPSNR